MCGLDLTDRIVSDPSETGARAALPVWVDFMKKSLEEKPYKYFDIPDDVVQIRMNASTGLRATDDSSGSVEAIFIKGTEPDLQ